MNMNFLPGADAGLSTTDSTTSASLARQFHAIFIGCERAHGTVSEIDIDLTRADGKVKRRPVVLPDGIEQDAGV